MRRARRSLLAASCVVLASCDLFAAQPRCELGAEWIAAVSGEEDFDGIALVPQADAVVALWSDARGLFARRISREGKPLDEPVRLWPACSGGLAALARDDHIAVACLIRARRGKHVEPGGVSLLRVDASLALAKATQIGAAGSLSDGVDMALAGAELLLSWHDASPDVHRVWWVRLHAASGRPTAEPRVLSRSGRLAGAPSVAQGPSGRPHVVWVERWLEGEQLQNAVVLWDGRGASHELLPLAHLNAMPRLVPSAQGLVLAYRDQPRSERRPGLYLARLDASGMPRGAPVRVGRADGIGRPDVRPCMEGFVTATPRTYAGDYFVGINWFDHALENPRGEQQFYEDTHAFTRATTACLDDRALVLIAEYGQLERAPTALRAVPYACR